MVLFPCNMEGRSKSTCTYLYISCRHFQYNKMGGPNPPLQSNNNINNQESWMAKEKLKMNFYLFLLAYLALLQIHGQGATDPTDGFISLPLNSSNFDIQKPYDLPVSERYSITNDIHKLWVLSTDKPHSPTSPTAPRSEIRISGYDYSSGVWQFEGHAYVPSGTTGVCIMQVFGANRTNTATALMLRVYNGALMYYTTRLIEDDIYGRWFRVNVIHQVGTGLLKVFIDGDLKLVAQDRGGASHYFKCGVYAQNYTSYFMESLWKDIKVLKLPD